MGDLRREVQGEPVFKRSGPTAPHLRAHHYFVPIIRDTVRRGAETPSSGRSWAPKVSAAKLTI